ncbi:MAG: M48 family metallopeptidase [Candidatus Heimdallarchaeota archaeon]
MSLSYLGNPSLWFTSEYIGQTLGFIIAILVALFMATELYSVLRHNNEPDLLMMLLTVLISGLVQGFTADLLLAILSGLCWLMIYSVYTIRESPVWRELMIASLISYLVILAGRIMQFVIELSLGKDGTLGGMTGSQYFGIAWNVFIYIFLILCLIFFGRRFFLVSRLTSPQIIYLLLFAVSYLFLYNFSDRLDFAFPGVPTIVGERVLFASFGTYEIMIITNFILYLISGPLLHLIFGVKKVKDERVLNLVEEVREKIGIKSKIKVGKVKAPILNAFAFGAFFDKRIAFMSRELDDLTDDDIRGIAGHELAHSKKVHTLWLLVITTVTFAITKALKLPATTLDYIFQADAGLDFLWYYLYNFALLVFSYLFVRMMEGQADSMTLKAGYGKSLAKSLVRLDGFYQGIASEMGMSVYLLTDKEQTKAEKIRFLGDSARNMYQASINPSKLECLINTIASHPKTAYRVVALTDPEKTNPVKAALLPFLLLIPFVRRKYIKELQSTRKGVSETIDETFEDSYQKKGVKDYDKLSNISYKYQFLKGKEIVAVSKTMDRTIITGNVKKVNLSTKVTSLIVFDIETKDGIVKVPLSDYKVFEMIVGQKQLFKNGRIGTIKEINTNPKKFAFLVEFTYNDNVELKELTVPGVPLTYLEGIVGKDVLLQQKGVTRLARLEKMDIDEESFGNSDITLRIGEETKTIKGKRFVLEFKPFDIYLKKENLELQRPIIEYLKGKPVSLQTKDDLDTLVKCTVKEVKEESLEVEILDEIIEVNIDRIEFIYFFEDSLMLIHKPSISFVERIFMALGNRNKLNYVIT